MVFFSHLWIIKCFPASTDWAVTTILAVILRATDSLLFNYLIKQVCLHFFQGVFLKSETKLLCYWCNLLCLSLKKSDVLKDKTNVAQQHPSLPYPVSTGTQLTSEIFPSALRYSLCVSFMYQNPRPSDKKWQGKKFRQVCVAEDTNLKYQPLSIS